MGKLLLEEYPLIVLPTLAKAIGLNEAVVLQQIHYWLQKSDHDYDGRRWVFNSVGRWNLQFPWWSYSTVRRILASLKGCGVLLTGNYNKRGGDKTLWYTIDYEQVAKLSGARCQVGTVEDANLNTALPETTTETTTEKSETTKVVSLSRGQQQFLSAFGAKRFANNTQKAAVLELEEQYPAAFPAALKWAAELGVARGKAISMMRTALPKWDSRGKGKRKAAQSTWHEIAASSDGFYQT